MATRLREITRLIRRHGFISPVCSHEPCRGARGWICSAFLIGRRLAKRKARPALLRAHGSPLASDRTSCPEAAANNLSSPWLDPDSCDVAYRNALRWAFEAWAHRRHGRHGDDSGIPRVPSTPTKRRPRGADALYRFQLSVLTGTVRGSCSRADQLKDRTTIFELVRRS
jgi:hypothetical protein